MYRCTDVRFSFMPYVSQTDVRIIQNVRVMQDPCITRTSVYFYKMCVRLRTRTSARLYVESLRHSALIISVGVFP